ncbi:PIG-L family deacetylase [Ancylobacter sp. GSK1Z-4-2]|nr:PIG-L deacetylase family protein [Ancylobacter mangrovi]MCS0501257.1 PIG-L family deacetylase [Ancylobacter mangrovi]
MTLTAGEALRAIEDFPVVEPAAFVRHGLLVVAPHPDDESLGCGGLIAACRGNGLPVTIVFVSDGAGSHPHSRAFPPPRLAALRREEAMAAAHQLGVEESHVHFIDLPDREVPTRGPLAEEAIARIAGLGEGADVVLVSWRHDPHCDHQASFELARQAVRRLDGARLFEYPVWGLTLSPLEPLDGPAPKGCRVEVEAFLPAKRRAIAAHASQTTNLIHDDPKGFRLTPSLIALFDTRFETYFEAGA